MKEIRLIVEAYGRIDFSKNRAALATVGRVEGSSYRRTGARMLVLDNGTYLGGVSGGCLEGDALRRAQKAIAANRPSVVTYDTTRDDHTQIGVGLGCNGIIDVLFTPLDAADALNPVNLLRAWMFSREPRLLATITGCKGLPDMLGKTVPFENDAQWLRDFPLAELAAGALADARAGLASGETRSVVYSTKKDGEMRVCLEVLNPSVQLLLFGGNADIYPLARIGKELGWPVTVVANPLKMEKPLFEIANVVAPNSGALPQVDPFTAIILMSHDYRTDLQNFRKILGSPARYIGLLGPRKRAQKMFDELAAEGLPVPKGDLERIFAPAGLDIGALSPEEIALSMAAEIIACFAKRPGSPLRLRKTAIHQGE